jgi:hypothetical protein
MTAFWGDLAQWMAFTEEQAVGGEVVEALMGDGTGSVEVTVFPENLAAKCKGERCGDGIVDVSGFDGDEAVEKCRGAGEPIGPPPAYSCVKEAAVVMQ